MKTEDPGAEAPKPRGWFSLRVHITEKELDRWLRRWGNRVLVVAIAAAIFAGYGTGVIEAVGAWTMATAAVAKLGGAPEPAALTAEGP